jgi:hypothetical protein
MLAQLPVQPIQYKELKMYRKHDEDFVANVDNVWPLIPLDDPEYQQWLAEGNVPLEQNEG